MWTVATTLRGGATGHSRHRERLLSSAGIDVHASQMKRHLQGRAGDQQWDPDFQCASALKVSRV